MFLEGYDWEDDNAVNKLRGMLWGLEALGMFDDRLPTALDSIHQVSQIALNRIETVSLPRVYSGPTDHITGWKTALPT